MTNSRLSPFQEFTPLWDVMDRFVTDSFGSPRSWTSWMNNGSAPMPVEVYETPDQFVVRAFAAGVTPDALNVEFDAGVLTIRAATKAPELKDGWKAILAEVPYGEFVRQLRLPRKIDVEGIQTTFEHGVLTLALPKVAEARPHRIEVRSPAQIGSGGGKTEG